MSNTRVPVPPGYQDSPKHRGQLVKHAREFLANAGHPGEWHVQHFEDQIAVMALVPAAHPTKAKIILAPNFTLMRAPEVIREASDQGFTVVEFVMDLQPGSRYAVAARVTPAVAVLTALLAGELGKFPHEIALNAVWSPEGHVEKVWVRNLPTTMSAEKLEATLRRFVAEIPGGNSSWEVDVDRLAGQAVLSYCPPAKLRGLVPFSEIALDAIDPSKRLKLPIGINSAGEEVVVDLKGAPHALVVGETGSGKSVCARVIMTQALARGYELVMIEPTKRAAGLKDFMPYSKGFFLKDAQQAADALEAVYAEVRRRVEAIDDVNGENWGDLPAGTVKPWLVVVDEFAGLIATDKKPAGDPKNPVVAELLEEWNDAMAAVSMIQSKVGRLAREARSAGVHIMLVTQRPDASDIPGQVRANLGSAVQLVAPLKPPSRDAMGMVFPGDGPAEALEIVAQFNDGKSPGLGVAFVDGGRLQGFRVALIEPGEVAPYLDRIGVPAGIPLIPGQGYGKVASPSVQGPSGFDTAPPPDDDTDYPF
jgi:hypothetical protein